MNVQHNCAENGCDTSAAWTICQERELTSRTEPQVKHYQPSDYILNMSQMQSQKYLRAYRIHPPSLDEDEAILSGVMREIDEHQTRGGRGRGDGWVRVRGSRLGQSGWRGRGQTAEG